MNFFGNALSRSLLGVKRTSPFAAHLSAFDPKRTLASALHISELSHAHRLSSSVNGVNRMLWRGAVGSISIRYTRSFRRLRGLVLGGLNATMFGPSMAMRQPEAVQSWTN